MTVDVQFNVDQALAKLGELVAKHGPQAVDLAAQVVQMDAAGQVARGVFFAVAAVGAGMAGLCFLSSGRKNRAEWAAYNAAYDAYRYPTMYGSGVAAPKPDRPNGAEPETLFATATGAGMVGAALLVIALFHLLDSWAWVALFNPKLALAHQLLAKFAGI